jgi:hypothetical protein
VTTLRGVVDHVSRFSGLCHGYVVVLYGVILAVDWVHGIGKVSCG